MLEFEQKLIEENLNVVWNVVGTLVKKKLVPASEYDDYYQMGCLELCKKVHKYNGSTKFKTFAETVLRNAFVDIHRNKIRHTVDALSLDKIVYEDDDGSDIELNSLLHTADDTENEVLHSITADLVRKHIAEAKKKCTVSTTVKGFEALELKIQGYSGREIADLYQVPANSVRSWISRAKRHLLDDKEFMKLLCNE